MLRWRVGIFVERVGMTPPSRILSIQVEIVLWCGVEVMHGISVLNGEGTIEALGGCVPLHTTSLTGRVDPNWNCEITWSGSPYLVKPLG